MSQKLLNGPQVTTARQQQAIAADMLQVEQTTLRITQAKVNVVALTIVDSHEHGVLRVVGFGFHQPSRYRLVQLKGRSVVPLCYVRGNSGQLNSLLDQWLQIQGRQYWVSGADYPVLIPERISPRTAP